MTTIMPERIKTGIRRIPCAIRFAPDLRKAAEDYGCEVTWVQIVPGTGRILARAEQTIYLFDCGEREGSLREAMKEVLIGLGCYQPDAIPGSLLDTRTPIYVGYAIYKIPGTKRSLFHSIKV